MSSGNHLTIRDYFNQMLVRGPANRITLSSKPANITGTEEFHRIFKSHQEQRSINNNQKITGLTIVDYLANRVRVKCRYDYAGTSTLFQKKEAKVDKSSGLSPSSSAKTAAAEVATPLPNREKIGTQTSDPLVSMSSQIKTGTKERLTIEKSISKAASRYNLPPGLIKGIIKAESNFQVSAVSHAGAQGLMQLMPGTAKELGVENPFDIDQNIDGGSRYLRKMLDNFDGDIRLALAAYNAGPGTVRKYEGDVPYQETQQYVARVLRFSKKIV
jgi:soluble lytic murein transglycosylase-like protein